MIRRTNSAIPFAWLAVVSLTACGGGGDTSAGNGGTITPPPPPPPTAVYSIRVVSTVTPIQGLVLRVYDAIELPTVTSLSASQAKIAKVDTDQYRIAVLTNPGTAGFVSVKTQGTVAPRWLLEEAAAGKADGYRLLDVANIRLEAVKQ